MEPRHEGCNGLPLWLESAKEEPRSYLASPIGDSPGKTSSIKRKLIWASRRFCLRCYEHSCPSRLHD